MKLQELLYEPGSLTQKLLGICCNLNLQVLKCERVGEIFKRVVIIKLNNTPVVLAISTTFVEYLTFTNILQSSNSNPIGLQLFVKSSSNIKRSSLKVIKLSHTTSKSSIIQNQENKDLLETALYLRFSIFKCKEELLLLKEYMLNGIEFFV